MGPPQHWAHSRTWTAPIVTHCAHTLPFNIDRQWHRVSSRPLTAKSLRNNGSSPYHRQYGSAGRTGSIQCHRQHGSAQLQAHSGPLTVSPLRTMGPPPYHWKYWSAEELGLLDVIDNMDQQNHRSHPGLSSKLF
jgi:hypothetical protein